MNRLARLATASFTLLAIPACFPSDDEPQTLQELGDRFGVSRERVRQLEARLTDKLRGYLRERLGDAVEIGA